LSSSFVHQYGHGNHYGGGSFSVYYEFWKGNVCALLARRHLSSFVSTIHGFIHNLRYHNPLGQISEGTIKSRYYPYGVNMMPNHLGKALEDVGHKLGLWAQNNHFDENPFMHGSTAARAQKLQRVIFCKLAWAVMILGMVSTALALGSNLHLSKHCRLLSTVAYPRRIQPSLFSRNQTNVLRRVLVMTESSSIFLTQLLKNSRNPTSQLWESSIESTSGRPPLTPNAHLSPLFCPHQCHGDNHSKRTERTIGRGYQCLVE
jgi:hypothetical protein